MPTTIADFVSSEFNKLNSQVRRAERGVRRNHNHNTEAPLRPAAKGTFPSYAGGRYETPRGFVQDIYGLVPNNYKDSDWIILYSRFNTRFLEGQAIQLLNMDTVLNAANDKYLGFHESKRGFPFAYQKETAGNLSRHNLHSSFDALTYIHDVWYVNEGISPGTFPSRTPKYTASISGTGVISTGITILEGMWAIVEVDCPWGITYGHFSMDTYTSSASGAFLSPQRIVYNTTDSYLAFGRSASNFLTVKTEHTLSNASVKVWTVKSSTFYRAGKGRFPDLSSPDFSTSFTTITGWLPTGIYPHNKSEWLMIQTDSVDTNRNKIHHWYIFRTSEFLASDATVPLAEIALVKSGGLRYRMYRGQFYLGEHPANVNATTVKFYYF